MKSRNLIAILVCALVAASGVWADEDAGAVVLRRGTAAFVVSTPETKLDQRVLERLTAYLDAVLGEPSRVVDRLDAVPEQSPAIVIESSSSHGAAPEAFALRTETRAGRSVVSAQGAVDRGRKRAVQRLILLGEQREDALVFPPLDLVQQPWIPCREWSICPWTPQDVRGDFFNPFADLRYNIYLYSDARLADYVAMFDGFGYSGCQLMETCYTYAQFGCVDAAQQWQKKVAGFAHENGQEVSLWAWAAEFSGLGWRDPEAVYQPREGTPAIDDPAVRATFEKYYRGYARLAPHIDRFIAHFYDPGRLEKESDVFDYMRLLESMLKEQNPNIRMGVDCWAKGPEYFMRLAQNGFGHYLLLPVASPEACPGDTRNALHKAAADLNLHVGIWGWYITEYESDQLASMYVNPSVIQNVYEDIRVRAGGHPIEYWSEMEAHHLINIFSMYVAAQLLWDPDQDPHEVLRTFVNAIWGPRSGPRLYEALRVIEDTRSGPTWDTYWWTRPGHRVGTDDPADDLRRAEAALADLQTLKADEGFVSKFTLPWPPEVFVELTIPHLMQIRDYARFRLDIHALRQAAEQGASKEELGVLLQKAWRPVPEYGTWVGVFGNHELRAQKKAAVELSREYGLALPDDPALRYLEADRMLQHLRRVQQGAEGPVAFGPESGLSAFWPEPYFMDRFQKLVDDGAVQEVEGGKFQLRDWRNWALR